MATHRRRAEQATDWPAPSTFSEAEDRNFLGLLNAPDAGWEVEPPVYARPRWGSLHEGQQVYHFILRRGLSITMLSVVESPRLFAFLDERCISVNRSH